MATFIVVEKAIKVEDVMQNLLRNQVLDAIDPEYYMELEHSIFQYDKVSVMELLNHLFKNYAKIDGQLLKNNKELYAEAPDLSKPIDVYFRKQEKCQKLSADGGNPISEVDMVLQL